MKSLISNAISTLFFVFFLFGMTQATPLYYTFEGTVTDKYERYDIFDEDIGDKVSYTFLIDLDRQGLVLNSDGSVFTYTDYGSGDSQFDYFYTDYVTGSAPEFSGFTQYPFEYNYGQSTINDGGGASIHTWGFVIGMNENNYIELTWGIDYFSREEYDDNGASPWQIGKEFTAVNRSYIPHPIFEENSDYSTLSSTVYLTNISSTNPIPEPTTAVLFSLGLLAIASVNRKRKDNTRYPNC